MEKQQKKKKDIKNSKQAEKRKKQKTCKSPPKGIPKKPKTLKEAIQLTFNKEISIKDEQGKTQKASCLEVLAMNIVADAIANDGTTRRMLLREDILNLESKEPELEFSPEEEELIEVENTHGKTIRTWAQTDPKIRDSMSRLLQSIIVDSLNEKTKE